MSGHIREVGLTLDKYKVDSGKVYYCATCFSIVIVLLIIFKHQFFSVKWLKKDEWMIDPVIIADIYEPEV